MKKLLGLLILALLATNTSAVTSSTTWLISPGYIQAYSNAYSVHWTEKGENRSISTEDYIPQYFYIWSVENTGYSYIIENLSSTLQSVKVDRISFGANSFDVLKGALPIILPTQFEGKDNWVAYYFSSLNQLISHSSSSDSLLKNLTLTFLPTTIDGSLEVSLEIVPLTDTSFSILVPYFQIINSLLNFKKMSLRNANISMGFSYITRSGILNELTLRIRAEMGVNNTQIMRSLSIDSRIVFALTVPPLNSESIPYGYSFLLALPLLSISRRRFKKLLSPSSSNALR